MTYLISQIRGFIVLHSGCYTQTQRVEGELPGGAVHGGEGAGCSYCRIPPDYMVYSGLSFLGLYNNCNFTTKAECWIKTSLQG